MSTNFLWKRSIIDGIIHKTTSGSFETKRIKLSGLFYFSLPNCLDSQVSKQWELKYNDAFAGTQKSWHYDMHLLHVIYSFNLIFDGELRDKIQPAVNFVESLID